MPREGSSNGERTPKEPHPDLVLLGEQIKYLRLERNWSQAVLAEKAECSTNAVIEIEAGRTDPQARTLISLARALGVTAGRFFRTVTPEGPVEPLPPLPRRRATRRVIPH